MYRMHRVFCATSWDLEGERRAFQDVLGAFNESAAMSRGVLYVPVSLGTMRDKRPYQYTVDENIRACRHYILAVTDVWGPPERNFEGDYQLALACRADPSLPMRECAVLVNTPSAGHSPPRNVPPDAAGFRTLDEFTRHVHRLLSEWIETDADTSETTETAGS